LAARGQAAEAAGNGYIRRVMAGMKPIANDAGIRDWQAKRRVARRLRSSQCLGPAGRNQQRAPSGKGGAPAEINSIETRCASAYLLPAGAGGMLRVHMKSWTRA